MKLKKWSFSDKESLIRLCNEADRRYLYDGLPYPYTGEDADRWLKIVAEQEGKGGIFRAITLDGEIIGNITVERGKANSRKDAELGYLLDRRYWSRGIMTEAVGQMCILAFEHLDIIRISASVYEPNLASARVLEKNGFLREGLLRNAVVKDDCIYNMCLYGKLREHGKKAGQ